MQLIHMPTGRNKTNMPLPNFLIIGESKCGTTSLYDNLIQHPQILPSKGNGDNTIVDATVPLGVKEIRFFDKNYHKGWDWYQSCFPECPEGCITGEASPTYFGRGTAMKRILEVMPDTKLILMLRNPVDRLISHYNHLCIIDKEFLDRYPTIEEYWLTSEEKYYHLIERGIYKRALEGLFAMCPTVCSKLYVVISEEFFHTPIIGTIGIFDFLGLDTYIVKSQHSRKRKTSPKKVSDSILNDMYSFYKGYNIELEKTVFPHNGYTGVLWDK